MPSIAETEMGEAVNASSISAAGSRSVPAWSSTASSPTDSSQASFSARLSPRTIPSRIETFISRVPPPSRACSTVISNGPC
ncbi:MAG: hypothetical protein K0R44_3432 [Thermomicrobiales bacterium]|nr:hypothetical protein [Thermomicrobiales bacterium]